MGDPLTECRVNGKLDMDLVRKWEANQRRLSEQHAGELVVMRSGSFYCSVCARKDLAPDEIVKWTNLLNPVMKTEAEIRAKLAEVLAIDARVQPEWMARGGTIFSKAAACATLLWALGENDDDRWHITAKPGPPVDRRASATN